MRHEDQYLDDALKAFENLQEFVARSGREQFLADRFKQSFVFHQFVILGEAAVALSRVYREKYPEVPWASISGLRNRLVHGYFELDLKLIWELASTRLDELSSQLKQILEAEFPSDPGNPDEISEPSL